MNWSRKFREPIELNTGKQIVTLRDVAQLLIKLPKKRIRSNAYWIEVGLTLRAIGHHKESISKLESAIRLAIKAERGAV